MFSQHEYCLLCSSLNKLLVCKVEHAWECWNCNARYWIDDQARLEYQVYYSINLDTAERDLIPTLKLDDIVVIGGYSECKAEPKSVRILKFCTIESND